jgi:protein-S-isoprenylcysteine O-methyltransferase Ste14
VKGAGALLLKTAVFSVLVPGTVAFTLPWLLLRRDPHPPRFEMPYAFGLLPLALGVAIYLRCAWDFVVTGLGTPAPVDPPKTLVVTGLYRWVRNPMYVGVLSAVLGQALLLGSLFLVQYAGWVFVAFLLFVVLYEEPSLERRFGQEYLEYRRAVPRFLPRLTPWKP